MLGIQIMKTATSVLNIISGYFMDEFANKKYFTPTSPPTLIFFESLKNQTKKTEIQYFPLSTK